LWLRQLAIADLSNFGAVDVTESGWVLVSMLPTSRRVNLASREQVDIGLPEGRFYTSIGAAMNESFQVAATVETGDTDPRGQFTSQVWRFSEKVGWEFMFGGGSSIDDAVAINNHGDVLGRITVGLNHFDMIYVQAVGQAFVVEDLLAEGFRGIDISVTDINAKRQIAAAGLPYGHIDQVHNRVRHLAIYSSGRSSRVASSLARRMASFPGLPGRSSRPVTGLRTQPSASGVWRS
jgi:hypothetical protein